jgi:hypothetical protein
VIKLYRKVAPAETHYHEAWLDGDAVVEHWGAVGNRGASRRHPTNPSLDEAGNLERVLAPARSKGFAPVPLEDHSVLLVEYTVEGMGNAADVEKRYRLPDRLDDLLGWTGTGHCDGGSIGSGTMEACCYVVNFAVARDVIIKDLADTEFANYTRIYEERRDEV